MSLALQQRLVELVQDEDPVEAIEALAGTLAALCSVYGGMERAIGMMRRLVRGVGERVGERAKEN